MTTLIGYKNGEMGCSYFVLTTTIELCSLAGAKVVNLGESNLQYQTTNWPFLCRMPFDAYLPYQLYPSFPNEIL